jgi:thymidylate synthase (FAD)
MIPTVKELADYPLAHDSPIRLVPTGYVIEDFTPDMLQVIERAGRTCYRSEEKAHEGSAERFVAKLIERGHESVLEFANIKVRITCDRGLSHQLVRHRIGSYAQESTRYCNYSSERFGGRVSVILPTHWPLAEMDATIEAYELAARRYLGAVNRGVSPEIARDLLPHATATQIAAGFNVREWRHVFQLRTDRTAHPRMRDLMRPMLRDFRQRFPVVFDDVGVTDCCPVCKSEADYDPNTWGNYYSGPKSPLKYVCPNCVGKGTP